MPFRSTPPPTAAEDSDRIRSTHRGPRRRALDATSVFADGDSIKRVLVRISLALAACAVAVVAGGVVWASRYQPLDAGIRGVRAYEPGLRPGVPLPHVSVELANTGRVAVTITDVRAARDTVVSFDGEFRDPRGPLRPFTLDPGQSEGLVISSSVPICTDRRPNDFRAPGHVRVSFEVYGIDREALVGEISEPQFNDDQRCILAAAAP